MCTQACPNAVHISCPGAMPLSLGFPGSNTRQLLKKYNFIYIEIYFYIYTSISMPYFTYKTYLYHHRPISHSCYFCHKAQPLRARKKPKSCMNLGAVRAFQVLTNPEEPNNSSWRAKPAKPPPCGQILPWGFPAGMQELAQLCSCSQPGCTFVFQALSAPKFSGFHR